MKFLLAAINAKYIHSNPGVYSLRAFARTKIPGADIEIGEYTINHQMDLILQDIYRRKPDFIGFSFIVCDDLFFLIGQFRTPCKQGCKPLSILWILNIHNSILSNFRK